MGFRCSGHIPSKEVEKILQDNLDLLDVVYKTNDFIATHAGLTRLWLDACKNIYSINNLDEILDKINSLFHEKDRDIMNYLSEASITSGCPYSIIASCLWARPEDHKYAPLYLGRDQIVGHTPITTKIGDSVLDVKLGKSELNGKIFYIDTFSTYRDSGESIGKNDILIFDNETKSYSSLNLITWKEDFICKKEN